MLQRCFVLHLIPAFIAAVGALFRSRVDIALEILALRQQVAVLKRQRPRRPLTRFDRFFWSTLRQIWPRWSDVLVIVKPETVIGWHRAGFRIYWRWRSRQLVADGKLAQSSVLSSGPWLWITQARVLRGSIANF